MMMMMTQLLTKKNNKKWFLKILCWNYTEKWLKITWKCKDWKWPLVCSNPNISASTWPKLKIKDSFEILRTSRFQNWHSFLNLVKIWGSYSQKTNCVVFLWTRCISQSNAIGYLNGIPNYYWWWHQLGTSLLKSNTKVKKQIQKKNMDIFRSWTWQFWFTSRKCNINNRNN